jgi:PAS domain S-box-containing protein
MNPTTILVVEDEKIIARGIEKRLKGMGYAVAALASTGEEAVQKATELRPDLVLMDIHLGAGMDGVEAAALIRGRLNLPVVYLTAHSDDATLGRAKLTEPFGYVLKPYEDKDLQTAIEIGLYKHRMERRLRENERWLAATLASIGDAVIATDEGGRVRFLNSVAEQLTGWTQADALGRDVVELFKVVEDHSRQPVPNPALEALARGETVTLARNCILINKARAEYPIDDSAAPIRDGSGQVAGAVLLFRNVTERCRLEEQLRHAQKLEAIGRLAGAIAHDFNNILTVITGYSDLLLDNPLYTEVSQEFLRQINLAGKRAATLTQQILAFSRKQVLVPCALSLNTIVRDMGGMVRRLIGEEIEFVTDTAPDLGPVKADPAQMGQVLLNLALNARDALRQQALETGRPGGRLVIATAHAELSGHPAHDHADLKPGRYAVLSVTDTGCGMPADVLAHVFEPFFTTKEPGKGTGLGLASVYGVVKQSGGHIEVSSQVGVGTTFRVYLPLVEEPKPEAPGPERHQESRGEETILLVEDEEGVRRITKTVLQRCGYQVMEAADGQEAVTLSNRYEGPIHLLITDLVMPQLSGRMVAERLALTRPVMRVLFMSGYTEDRIVHQAVDSATAAFLPKPFTLDALLRKVREVLDRP